MKKVTIILMAILLLPSCSENKQKKLIGTWGTTTLKEDWYGKDSILCKEYLEFTKTGDVYYLGQPGNGKWDFSIKRKRDSLNYDIYKLISKNEFEIQLPEETKKFLGIKKNSIYTRISRDIKPNKLIFDFLNNFLEYGNSLSIDTLGGGTVMYQLDMEETKAKSTSELGNLVKYFFDKQIGSLPKEDKEGKYSIWEKAIVNIYTWENLETKLLMECYFKNKDLTDEFTYNDKDYIEIKIWHNVK